MNDTWDGVRLYCGVGEKSWNTVRANPGKYACVSPVQGKKKQVRTSVSLDDDVAVIQDSGTYSDRERLSIPEAHDRQVSHAERYGYASLITHRVPYDLLIDEKWIGGTRKKQRWSVEEASFAVNETVAAVKWYAKHNLGQLVLTVQGVSADQYIGCAERVITLNRGNDILGLGGWCIIGMARSWLPEFWRAMWRTVELASKNRVGWVHIFGVVYPVALGGLLWICDQYDVLLSTDSSGPAKRPALSRRWGYGNWGRPCYFPPGRERGEARIRHVKEVREWLSNLRETEYYKEPPRKGL
jgi:hypothetical protein